VQISEQAGAFPYHALWPKEWIEEYIPRAKVTIFPGSSLFTPKDAYQGFQDGLADFGWIPGWIMTGPLDIFDIFELPGIVVNQPGANWAIREVMRKYPQFEEVFSPKVQWLATQSHLCTDLHSSTPVRSLDDLKGLVIGCQTAAAAETLSALGASSTVIASPDMYTSAERGVIDGVVGAWGLVSSRHLYEVFNYHTNLGISPGLSHWVMNRETWDKLTEEEQNVFTLLEPHLQYAVCTGNGEMVINVLGEHVLGNPEHEIIELPPEDVVEMKSLFEPLWDGWVEKMEAQGLPARDILNDTLLFAKVYK